MGNNVDISLKIILPVGVTLDLPLFTELLDLREASAVGSALVNRRRRNVVAARGALEKKYLYRIGNC